MLKAANIAKAIIAAHPDLDGIFASNQNSAIGLAQAIKTTGRQDLVTVGFDSGKAQIEAVKHGALDGSITQNPVGMGYKLVETAVNVIMAKKYRKPSAPVTTGMTRAISIRRKFNRICISKCCASCT